MNSKSIIAKCINAIVHNYDVKSSIMEFDDASIAQLIDDTIRLLGVRLSDVEREEIRKVVYYRCQIKATDGEMISNEYCHYKWYDECDHEDEYFWTRYRNYLLDDKGFGLNIVNKLEKETLRELMNCIGDPKSTSPYLRRGLVIGDVQSGKTSTYTGLICKAADAGYKVIILLTGTIESLRTQTQQRIEEGFVGYDSSKLIPSDKDYYVGVGKNDRQIKVTVLTSRDDDFTSSISQIVTSIESNKIVLFVIKKNVTVLTKLLGWLKSRNAGADGRIHYPMLLIDDEADNASINTRKEDEDPTKTNALIRKLIDIFTQSNYVGFTATPFANIFINPTTTAEMENMDLFPENFIYCLPTPQDYIGPTSIFGLDGHYRDSLIPITDAGMEEEDGYPFFCKHKKHWNGTLPSSLTDAVYAFLLANAIRDLRQDTNSHRSMLINMSRFVKVQHVIKRHVEQILKDAYSAIKFHCSKDNPRNLSNPILKKMYEIWDKYYSSLEFDWDDICQVLLSSIEHIQISVVNSSKNSDKLNYNEHDKEGLRVIAIGGLALSRGLTLEGLIVSYFFRNTATYDVLMQMGRWFGYRKGYEDVFRIWIGEDSANWYGQIADATELLKQDMRKMREAERTPKDFGIRVRKDSNELGITARNKMRSATTVVEYESYLGSIVQAPYIYNDISRNCYNKQCVEKLIAQACSKGATYQSIVGREVLRGVDKLDIVDFLSRIKIHPKNQATFDEKDICENILACSYEKIQTWDIAIVEGAKTSAHQPVTINGKKYYPTNRKFISYPKEGRLSVSTRGQLTGPSDAQIGLDSEQIAAAKSFFYAESTENTSRNVPAKYYFKALPNRRPLLLIYFIKLKDNEQEKYCPPDGADNADFLGVSFAVGMPISEDKELSKIHRYAVNRVYMSDYYEGEEE